MKTNVTELTQKTTKTYRVTQRVIVEMEVDVEATSAENAKDMAHEWSPSIWEDHCEQNSFWDENNELRCEEFTLFWEIIDIKDVEPTNIIELDDE